MSRWLAIVNPAAGQRGEAQQAVRELLAGSQLAAAIETTRAPGHATELARAARDADGFVVVGGDGTVAEVLAGMDIARQHLAVVPAGHGNCLARDLGVRRPREAIAALERGQTRAIDLMRVAVSFQGRPADTRWAASTLATGYVCDVVLTGRRRLPWLGRHAYAAAAAITVPRALAARVAAASLPEALPGLTGIVVNNTAHLANFRAFADASLSDGRLDIMENACAWPRQMLHNAAVLAGSSAFGAARVRQAPDAQVDFDATGTLMVDGEILEGVTGFTATCERAAVTCIVNGA
jgi:diacylglycerol kinase (ATP)